MSCEAADKKTLDGQLDPEEHENSQNEMTCAEGKQSRIIIKSKSNKSISEFNRKEIGEEGESIAAKYLEMRHYTVIARNWKCSQGEIDIVAFDPYEEHTVLVEVKTLLKLDHSEGLPELSINARKKSKYCKLAKIFMAENPEANHIRFDVIAINIVGEKQAKLRHLLGAFWCDES